MNIIDFIPQNLFIAIAVIYVLGIFLKRIESVPDKWITVILMLFGITVAILLDIIQGQYDTLYKAALNGLLQGILCWGVAVGVNQTLKQIQKEE